MNDNDTDAGLKNHENWIKKVSRVERMIGEEESWIFVIVIRNLFVIRILINKFTWEILSTFNTELNVTELS